MFIYVDTNIAVQNNYFKGSSLLTQVLKASHFLGFTVVIPEVVSDEIIANYKVSAESAYDDYIESSKKLAAMSGMSHQDYNIEVDISNFAKWLESLFEKYGVVTLPYPDISLKELVEAGYEAEKPFKANGNGYKDYLIWQSILLHSESLGEGDNVFLLTDNVSDFCEKKDSKVILHSSLSEQLKDGLTLPVFVSAKQFFSEIIHPHLKGVNAQDLPEITTEDILRYARDSVEDDLNNYEAFGFEGLPFSNEVSVDYAEASELKVDQMLELDDDILIEISGAAELDISGYMGHGEYYSYLEESKHQFKLSIIDGRHNDHVMSVSALISSPIELTVTYSKTSKKITGHNIRLLKEIEDPWPYK